MSKRIKKRREAGSTFEDNAALIMGIFTLIVLCIFPLVYHRYYFDILETKYQFYCAAAIGTSVVMLLYGIISGRLKSFFSDLRLKAVSYTHLASSSAGEVFYSFGACCSSR